ncbi:MAG: hypothetical protein KJ944_11745 [Alphaproteobacteria bacterium]|nr:hypothetical protein [Alphaproteobacteria bacterium]MBU1560096.1 hypothetical protein [Alphaproteobacteria bacterium]MBU2303258.1 hypothetical protein [Alphaproteobacteria bacterium]MBU2366145.1 hypothetical protein [Alphaproteobacteria bacterium]
MNIATETRILIEAALAGDPDLASLAVAGSSPETLSVRVAPGVPAKSIGGSSYSPEPPFCRETLAELVVRMQHLRWQRAAPLTPLAMPPEDRDMRALHEKHLRATVGFECGPGWADLFDAVFSWLHEIAADHDWSPSQIKEKYGTLRLYWYGDLPPLGAEIIEAAEHISSHLCEVCGAPGRLQSQHGWWTTRCRDHES